MENEKTKLPNWYWAVGIFFLLWNIMGLLSFYMHTFISEEALMALPDNERALYTQYPLWTTIAFAIAVFFGFAGSVGLILKKKWAKMAFFVSFGALVPQMIQNVFFTTSIDVYGVAQTITMPILVVSFGLLSIWFSKYCIEKNWLK